MYISSGVIQDVNFASVALDKMYWRDIQQDIG